MPKALTFLLLLVCSCTIFAQKRSDLTSSFYVQQTPENGIQLQVPVSVKQQAFSYDFDALLMLTPLEGYDAEKKLQSVFFKELQIYTNSQDNRKTKIIGRLDLDCCFGIIARVELQDRLGNTLEITNTNDKGEFSFIADHGKLLTEDRKTLSLGFGKLVILDMMGNKHRYSIRKVL